MARTDPCEDQASEQSYLPNKNVGGPCFSLRAWAGRLPAVTRYMCVRSCESRGSKRNED